MVKFLEQMYEEGDYIGIRFYYPRCRRCGKRHLTWEACEEVGG